MSATPAPSSSSSTTSSTTSPPTIVRFRCVREGSRVRVRVITPGYNPYANCQFPRDGRVVGKEYEAPVSALSFSDTRGKFFYRVKPKEIREVDILSIGSAGSSGGSSCSSNSSGTSARVEHVFESADCVVCLDCEPAIIFAPCGHFCACEDCARQLFSSSGKRCPMCRATIAQCVTKAQLQ